ncbi:MAG: apolipoprotein N-acyltransferase [Gammaproteobacteria bacterium]|nr:apolipoprotein N-acyltransferase [Gammaproteobacteria bacterium]
MKLSNTLYPFLFGLIGIFAFSPFSIKFLIFISYIYLIKVILYKERNALTKLFCWGLGHWGFGMSWLIVSIYYYGEVHLIVSLLIFSLLVILLTFVFTIPLLLTNILISSLKIKAKLTKTILVSGIFLLIEFSRYFFLNGVPWLIPGNIFLDTITQSTYSVFGVSFASLLIYLICSIIVQYNKSKITAIALGFLFISLIPQNSNIIINNGIFVTAIQPSSNPFFKYKKDYYQKIEKNLLTLINQSSQSSKLIVLPEAELPYHDKSEKFNSFISKINNKEKLLLGTWHYDENKLFNAFLNVKSDKVYKKIHLVPFGEYIPFFKSLRGLIDFFNLPMSNVDHGSKNQNKITVLNGLEVSTPICFDIAFPRTVRLMNKSSLFMINISNDTWFGESIGPYHHLSIARIRSIENNRWTLRATNNGFSAIISNKGTIVDKLEKGDSNILEGYIDLINKSSFYNKIGYIFSYLILLILISSIIIRFLWLKL